MSAPKPLKDLPGFREYFAEALERNPSYAEWVDLLPDATIPGITQITNSFTIEYLFVIVGYERRRARRHLRLVPKPARIAANDCEAQ